MAEPSPSSSPPAPAVASMPPPPMPSHRHNSVSAGAGVARAVSGAQAITRMPAVLMQPPLEARDPKSGAACPLGPGDPPPYGDTHCGPAYWDARHAAAGDEPYDWYMDYTRLAPVLRLRLPPADSDPEVLDVGCGTSELASCLWADGWRNVIGVDTSVVAVTRARGARRHQGRHELQFLQMDACGLEFPDACFHAVVDKALFDTIVTGGHAFPRGRAMLREVYRVLRPGGVFFLVSLADVASRLPWLALDAEWGWRVEVARVPRPVPICLTRDSGAQQHSSAASELFYVYICTKPLEKGCSLHDAVSKVMCTDTDDVEASSAQD